MNKRSSLHILSLILVSILFCQCANEENLKWALKQAGNNHHELETVLSHYRQSTADSLKYQAALFLIVNMPGHYSYQGNEIHNYYENITPILNTKLSASQKKDSIEKIAARYPRLRERTIEDIQVITAHYLIKNIDRAFEDWQKPWANHLTFEQFCEYLLPYKYTELQLLDAWRDTLSTKFCDDITRFPENDETPKTFRLAQTINREIRRKVKVASLYNLGEYTGYEFWSASTIHKLPFGLCPEYVALGTLALCSYGIPTVAEHTPLWGRGNTGHSWYTILNTDGSKQPTRYDISTDFGSTLFPTQTMPKIYRHTYARNPDAATYLRKAKHIHPFVNLFEKDVTDEYISTTNITVPLFKESLRDDYAYIAAFNESDWQVLDYGTIKNRKALFKKMGRDMLYIAQTYDGMRMHPTSHPFILHKNGNTEYIKADTSRLQTIQLWRKYPKNLHVANMQQRVLGGKIQAAHKEDFTDSVTLYTINTLNYPDRIPLDSTGTYRYWRYVAPKGTYGNIAELAFFDENGTERRGAIIGANGNRGKEKEKAFDDDWFTFYDSWDKEPWVGMDFGGPVRIEKVRCIPRTDDNYIHPGDEYELKYWDKNGWQSLGIQTADDSSIIYDNVPENALLWLSNLSRGKQERIFTYKEGKQIWW